MAEHGVQELRHAPEQFNCGVHQIRKNTHSPDYGPCNGLKYQFKYGTEILRQPRGQRCEHTVPEIQHAQANFAEKHRQVVPERFEMLLPERAHTLDTEPEKRLKRVLPHQSEDFLKIGECQQDTLCQRLPVGGPGGGNPLHHSLPDRQQQVERRNDHTVYRLTENSAAPDKSFSKCLNRGDACPADKRRKSGRETVDNPGKKNVPQIEQQGRERAVPTILCRLPNLRPDLGGGLFHLRPGVLP